MIAEQWVATDFGGPEVLQLRTIDLTTPGPDEVTIEIRASGMNPVDYRRFSSRRHEMTLPVELGEEIAGVVTHVGAAPRLGSGSVSIGDEVVAYRVSGGYSSALTVRAQDVFAKPRTLGFSQAANCLLVGTTATEMLHVTRVRKGDVVLLHGASGAVGASVLQQARLLGVTVIGTASAANFASVERFGGIPVEYGPGLADRIRRLFPGVIMAALDTVGTAEAIDVSLALVADPHRIVTIAAPERAKLDGIRWIVGSNQASKQFRDAHRRRILELASNGLLKVPIGATYGFDKAPTAVAALMGPHAGKLALVQNVHP